MVFILLLFEKKKSDPTSSQAVLKSMCYDTASDICLKWRERFHQNEKDIAKHKSYLSEMSNCASLC